MKIRVGFLVVWFDYLYNGVRNAKVHRGAFRGGAKEARTLP